LAPAEWNGFTEKVHEIKIKNGTLKRNTELTARTTEGVFLKGELQY
jgi:hypothetical protein